MALRSRPEPSPGKGDETYYGAPAPHLGSSASRRHQHPRRDGKMTMARKLVYGLLAFVLVALGLATAAADSNGGPAGRRTGLGRGQAVLDQDDSTFKQLLSSASPEALHKLLHEYFPGTFQDGVYVSDKSAVEAIRSEDAGLATSLVHLAKRQNDSTAGPNSISSTVLPTSSAPNPDPGPSSSDPPPSPSPTPSSPAPSESPTTPSNPPPQTTPSSSPSGPSSPAPSSVPDPTPSPTPSSGPTGGPSSGGNGTPTSNTSGSPGMSEIVSHSGPVPAPESSTSQASHTGLVPASSSISTPLSTSSPASFPSLSSLDTTLITSMSDGPRSSASRRTMTFTSTLPGGRVTTITSVEIVTGAEENSSPTATGQGRLQTGAATPRFAGPRYEVVLGAVIGGVLLA